MDASLPVVTVIIPVWNDTAGLARTIEGLRAQVEGGRATVVVVDNASHDDVTAVTNGRPNVRLLHEPTPGSYAARNRGIRAARGDVLAFTDADCRPAPDWIERGLVALAAPDSTGVVAGPVDVVPGDAGRPTAGEAYDMAAAFPVRRFVEQEGFGVTANLWVRRDVMDKVGPFDASLKSGGDREWCLRAAQLGHPVRYADGVRVEHPARRLGEILRKYRRVIGGRTTLNRSGGVASRQAAAPARGRVRALGRQVLPVHRIREIRDDAAREGRRFPWRARAVAVLVQWTVLAESFRLRLGGKPRR